MHTANSSLVSRLFTIIRRSKKTGIVVCMLSFLPPPSPLIIVDNLGMRLSMVNLKLLTCDSSSNLSDVQTSLAISLTYYRNKSKLGLILLMPLMVQSAYIGALVRYTSIDVHMVENSL